VGTILSLRFSIDQGFIAVTAVVRGVLPGSVGVQFLDLSPEHLGRLEAFIGARAGDAGA
jgi:hypothetical protein